MTPKGKAAYIAYYKATDPESNWSGVWEIATQQLKEAWAKVEDAVLTSQWRPVTDPPQYESMRVLLRGGGPWTAIEAFAERSRLRTHWSEIPPFMEPTDPYAELKVAHAAGKVIQRRNTARSEEWIDLHPNDTLRYFEMNYGASEMRIKPWTLSRHLPGFRALEHGEEWHRTSEWTEDMLPDGWRPLLLGETGEHEILNGLNNSWEVARGVQQQVKTRDIHYYCRTRRPLPPTREELERKEFEEWYSQNAFDYVANPIGSRECGLQWKAWQAARKQKEAK